jgi:hypothetical protein
MNCWSSAVGRVDGRLAKIGDPASGVGKGRVGDASFERGGDFEMGALAHCPAAAATAAFAPSRLTAICVPDTPHPPAPITLAATSAAKLSRCDCRVIKMGFVLASAVRSASTF